MKNRVLGALVFMAGLCGTTGALAATQVSSPVVVASQADLSAGLLSGTQPDAPTSSWTVAGRQFWITSSWKYSGDIVHELTEGDVDHPFQTIRWVKPACIRNSSSVCVNALNATVVFTQLVPTDVRQLWFVGVYRPDPATNELLGIIHEEQVAGSKTRLGLAWSSDGGNTWTYLGRIVAQDGDPDANIQGAPYLIKNGFIYLYYNDNGGLGVSRAPLASVLASARAGSVGVGLWNKYFNGGFTEPALAGRGSTLGPFGISHTQAIHSNSTGKDYLALTLLDWDGQNSFVKLYESTDAITWTPSVTLADEPAGGLRPNGGYQYCSLIDPSGRATGVTDAAFDVVCVKDPIDQNAPNVGLYRWHVDLVGTSGYYRQSVDFKTSQGPVWWYQAGKNSVIYDMTLDGSFWHGVDRWAALYSDSMHPAADEIPVLKWVAPRTGRIRIQGTLRDADISCGNGVHATVVQSSTTLFSASIANGDTVGKSIDVVRDVSAGEGVFFMVDANGSDYYCDTTRWDPSIIYQ